MDSNHRRRAPADLQSAPFGHSGIFPICKVVDQVIYNFGADGGIRTPDQLITNQLLWPTELHRRFTFSRCKGTTIFLICKFFCNFFFKKIFQHPLFQRTHHLAKLLWWKIECKYITILWNLKHSGHFFSISMYFFCNYAILEGYTYIYIIYRMLVVLVQIDIFDGVIWNFIADKFGNSNITTYLCAR